MISLFFDTCRKKKKNVHCSYTVYRDNRCARAVTSSWQFYDKSINIFFLLSRWFSCSWIIYCAIICVATLPMIYRGWRRNYFRLRTKSDEDERYNIWKTCVFKMKQCPRNSRFSIFNVQQCSSVIYICSTQSDVFCISLYIYIYIYVNLHYENPTWNTKLSRVF